MGLNGWVVGWLRVGDGRGIDGGFRLHHNQVRWLCCIHFESQNVLSEESAEVTCLTWVFRDLVANLLLFVYYDLLLFYLTLPLITIDRKWSDPFLRGVVY